MTYLKDIAMALSAEQILLAIQKKQADHDERAHRDILLLDTQTRVKHMVLHFLKYTGKIAEARRTKDQGVLERILVDTFIICLATANSLNVSLGEKLGTAKDFSDLAKNLAARVSATDLFEEALTRLAITAGKMAKAVESSDHWEKGNFRADMEGLVVDLNSAVIGLLGKLSIPDIPAAVKTRWHEIEQKQIFSRLNEFQ